MNPVLVRLHALERALVAAGWVPMSTWWVDTFTRFVGAVVRQLVARVGRRGGKSSSLCRFAVAFALAYDVALIPPGDVGVVAFISARQDEASQRLRTIKAILDVVGVEWKSIDGGIALAGRPIVFKVFPASIAGVSGFTSILVICDEVAKWRDADTGANPATDVLASVRPTLATQRAGRMVLSSSPLTHEDAHAKAFDEGDTEHQVTAFAETWLANPTITEQETRDDEPNTRVWAREYAAIPQASVLGAFDGDAVKRAFRHPRPEGLRMRARLIIDASSGKKDRFTAAVVRWVVPGRGQDFGAYLSFDHVATLGEGAFWKEKGANSIADALASLAGEWKAKDVHGDQRESYTWRSLLETRGLTFHEHPYTSSSKPAAVERVRRWMAEGVLALCAHEKLERELVAFEERALPSGALTFGARGSGHDDFVALVLTAALAELDGHLVHEEPDVTTYIGAPLGGDRGGGSRGSRSVDTQRDPYLLGLIRARHNLTKETDE